MANTFGIPYAQQLAGNFTDLGTSSSNSTYGYNAVLNAFNRYTLNLGSRLNLPSNFGSMFSGSARTNLPGPSELVQQTYFTGNAKPTTPETPVRTPEQIAADNNLIGISNTLGLTPNVAGAERNQQMRQQYDLQKQQRYAQYNATAASHGFNDDAAIKKFQLDHGLTADGLWGAKTEAAWNADNNVFQMLQYYKDRIGGSTQKPPTNPSTPTENTPKTANIWDNFKYSGEGEWWKAHKVDGKKYYADAAGNQFNLKNGASNIDDANNRQYGGFGIVSRMANPATNHLRQSRYEFDAWYDKQHYSTNGEVMNDTYRTKRNLAYEGWLKQTTGKNSWEQFKIGGKLINKSK